MTAGVTEELRPVPWGWYHGLGLVLVVAFVTVWWGFDSIPDPMPVHWGPDGRADGFADKSLAAAFALVGLGPAIVLVTGAGSAALIHSQARTEPRTLTDTEINRRRLGSNLQQPTLGGLMFALGSLMTAGIAGSLLGWLGGAPMTVFLLGGVLVLLGWFFLRLRRNGRILDETYPPEDPGQRLKWGMFYFNPDDERAVIDLEGGSMTTFNFARPGAWGILAGILAPVILVVVLAVAAG